MLELLENSTDQFKGNYYPTTCLVLCRIIVISFIFKEYWYHHIFRHVAKPIKDKFKKY